MTRDFASRQGTRRDFLTTGAAVFTALATVGCGMSSKEETPLAASDIKKSATFDKLGVKIELGIIDLGSDSKHESFPIRSAKMTANDPGEYTVEIIYEKEGGEDISVLSQKIVVGDEEKGNPQEIIINSACKYSNKSGPRIQVTRIHVTPPVQQPISDKQSVALKDFKPAAEAVTGNNN